MFDPCGVVLLCYPASGRPLAWFEWGGCWCEVNLGATEAEADEADAALSDLEDWFEADGPYSGAGLPAGWLVAGVFPAGRFGGSCV